jgi:outer membrane biosynthesis protein TonB
MIIKTTGNAKTFDPDPALDTGRDYEARIVGVFHRGIFEKNKWENDKIVGTEEEEQVTLVIELTEEDTYVERGEDDNKKLVPRRPQWLTLKYSSHEKSNLFATAKLANPKAAWMEGKQGCVDPTLILNQPVAVQFNEPTDTGAQYMKKKLLAIPAKYKDGVAPATSPLFCYSVDTGSHVGTIEDVPAGMLRHAIDNAINVEEFGQLEAIEEHLAKLEAQKEEGTSLEGDESPAKREKAPEKAPKAKRTKKADEPKEEDKVEDAATEEPVEKPKRSRRAAKVEEVDHSTKSVAELEDLLIEKGITDEELDEISDAAESDEGYQEDLIAKLKSL